MNSLTNKFKKKYPQLSADDLFDIDARTEKINPEYFDKFYNLYLDNYDYAPTPKRIMEILNTNKHMYRETAREYGGMEKTTKWRGHNLFPAKYCDGEYCIICLSPKDSPKASCLVTERDENGYEQNQYCACSGADPHLELYEEWIAENRRRNENGKGLIDYNFFYREKTK